MVRIDREAMIQSVEHDISIGLIVDRAKFHEALEEEISSYMEKLRNGEKENPSLRENFIKKMNLVCGI